MTDVATPEASNKVLRKTFSVKNYFFKAAVGFPQAGGDLSLGLTLYMLAKKAILAQFPYDKCLIPYVPFSLQ